MNRHHKKRCCPGAPVATTWNSANGMSRGFCFTCGLQGPGVRVDPCPDFPEANGATQTDLALALFWKMKKRMKWAAIIGTAKADGGA